MTEAVAANLKRPPVVSGAQEQGGHMPEFEADYCAFISRAHTECGELAEFDFGGQETILMSGPDAQEVFFRTPDEIFSQAQAYQVMVPVFGPGVIFDATPERCKTQLKIQVDALRYQNMKHYAAIIAKEVEDWVAEWGDEGELDFLDEFIRLTLHTACHCLLGPDFRYQMTEEFKRLYHDLEKGLQAIAFVEAMLGLLLLTLLMIWIFVELAQLPGAKARERNHLQAEAINVCGWWGALTMGLLRR